ncbi:MAG: hypothetical protein IT348_09395 [Candidatus Eisenbacteria bacterium]|nr:hypothetical protein [Candidatus Eisenbacteria bacterium]
MKNWIGMLATAALLLAYPSGARSEGLNLLWGGCPAGGGVSNWQFACSSNIGLETLYASLVAPAGLNHVEGVVLTLDVISEGQFLPAWWTIRNIGACRNGALTLSTVFASDPGCTDLWLGAETTRTNTWATGYASMLNRGRLVATVMLTDTTAFVAAEPGVEYFALKLPITNVRTTGSGSCEGCSEPACLVLSSMRLIQFKGAGDVVVTAEAGSRVATWQGAASGACLFVPARNRTWGGIKTLYH